MSSKGDQLADIALSYCGTKFFKHGRDTKNGLDCAGLVVCALREMGIECQDPKYILGSFHDHFNLMTECLSATLIKVEPKPTIAEMKRGDVLAMRFPGMPNHLGIYVGRTCFVHAQNGQDVRVLAMDYSVLSRIQSVWRLP